VVCDISSNQTEHCEERDQYIICKDCEDKFCSECFETQHSSKKKQNHQKIIMDKEYYSQFCTIHPKEKLEFYCLDHKMSICKTCTELFHKNHNYDTFDKIRCSFMEIKKINPKDIQEQYKNWMNLYEQEQKEIHESFQNTRDKFQLKFDVIKVKKEKIEKDFAEFQLIMKKLQTDFDQLPFNDLMEMKWMLQSQCWDFPLTTHKGIICDHCKAKDFSGVRFRCLDCPNFDLCDNCINFTDIHNSNHSFQQIKEPVEVDIKTVPHNGVTCNKCRKSNFTGNRFACTHCKKVNYCEECHKDYSYIEKHHFNHIFVRISDIVSDPHENVKCNHCQWINFKGKRYSCKSCLEFDLCEYCFENRNLFHPYGHIFKVYSTPQHPDVLKAEIQKNKKKFEEKNQKKMKLKEKKVPESSVFSDCSQQ
jgi:hypothetical protein